MEQIESIFRERTEADPEFIDISTNDETVFDKFRKSIEKAEKEAFSQGKPFCARCAKLDFKKAWLDKIKEKEDTVGYIEPSKLKIKMLDLKQYGKEDRFEDKGESYQIDAHGKFKGDKAKRVTYHEYKCKVKGCGISIQIKEEDL